MEIIVRNPEKGRFPRVQARQVNRSPRLALFELTQPTHPRQEAPASLFRSRVIRANPEIPISFN